MKLVLFRHATRSPHALDDSSLSTVGYAQAEDLVSALLEGGAVAGSRPPKPTRLLASPKRRAQETLRPTAAATRIQILTDARLDERRSSEPLNSFENRIREFFSSMAELARTEMDNPESCVYVCSHLDWLEAATVLMPSDLSEAELVLGWSTAGYRIFRFDDGLWKSIGVGAIPPRG